MSIVQDLADIRVNYMNKPLNLGDIAKNPILQFQNWFDEAVRSEVPEPNAMTLATSTKLGIPSARIVLLKGLVDGGFIFYTNYTSKKALELLDNPNSALLFFWCELSRQVRLEGTVKKLDEDTSERYFKSRPRGSQISAWASPQSQIVTNRDSLEQERLKIEQQFREQSVLPKPSFWGGFIFKPHLFEFWQGRLDRFHDRFQYSWNKEVQDWQIDRLAP
jgi:pyridoxamine 5'-phosphate oxidase